MLGRRAALLGASSFATLFATLAAFVLVRGYPHEDAYILFKYARHVGAGLGCVFSPEGPHSEGATDFLWMMALAAFSKVGLDPAIGAVFLNTAGAGFGVYVMLRAIERHAGSTRLTMGVSLFAAALLLIWPWTAAGAIGFSATLYAAIALHLYFLLVDDRVRWVPWVALLLGLVRPDGVLLGAAATVMAIARARRTSPRSLVAVLGASAACATIGAAYFVARARYFGQTLPLPLIVKSHYEGRPPGIDEALDWAASTVLPLVGFLLVMRIVFGERARAPKRAFVALFPFVVHVLGFVPSFPSQNIANRFQAPATLVLFVLVTLVATHAIGARVPGASGTTQAPMSSAQARMPVAKVGLLIFGFVFATGFQVLVGGRAIAEALARDYVNPFSVRLGLISASRATPLRVASTEAGRILYWVDGPVLDLVGLNTRETAAVPPTRALLDGFDPDVIMFHHASGLDEARIEARFARTGEGVFRIEGPLASYVVPWNAKFVSSALPPYATLNADNVRVAPMATAAFLDERANIYELWASRFEARFARFHVYAVRASLPEKEQIVRELERAHQPAEHGSHMKALATGVLRH